VTYRERLTPGIGVWVILVGLGVALGLIFAPIAPGLAVGVAIVGVLVMLTMGWTAAATVEVVDGTFHAGRAQIPVRLISGVEALGVEPMRQARGPSLDARAYLCLRGWIATGVRVAIDDPDDPTPYWLVSSRHPEQLSAALTAAPAPSG
jgi:hypothetical protein